MEIDHYLVLGLASGEEGAKLSETEISSAYRRKAKVLHPDKNKNPDANSGFLKLQSSYEILMDAKARKAFDDHLRVKRKQYIISSQRDSKRQKMIADLEKREQTAFAQDTIAKSRVKEEEDSIIRKFKEEIENMRSMQANKRKPVISSASRKGVAGVTEESLRNIDREKMVKVSWIEVGENYTSERLKELFSKFGEVEDVVLRSSKIMCSAIVQMATKEAAMSITKEAAMGRIFGNLSNPLLVLPVKLAAIAKEFSSVQQSMESSSLGNLVGVSFKSYEDYVLKKLQRVGSA